MRRRARRILVDHAGVVNVAKTLRCIAKVAKWSLLVDPEGKRVAIIKRVVAPDERIHVINTEVPVSLIDVSTSAGLTPREVSMKKEERKGVSLVDDTVLNVWNVRLGAVGTRHLASGRTTPGFTRMQKGVTGVGRALGGDALTHGRLQVSAEPGDLCPGRASRRLHQPNA